MFGRATIRLGIGPYSSLICCGFVVQQVDNKLYDFLECYGLVVQLFDLL